MSASRFRLACPACTRAAEPAALGRCPGCGAVLHPLYSDAALRELTGIAPDRGRLQGSAARR